MLLSKKHLPGYCNHIFNAKMIASTRAKQITASGFGAKALTASIKPLICPMTDPQKILTGKS